jgi:RimJ/RimL family protein N-acetyltransferase
MLLRPNDILTQRLVLRLLEREALEACLAGDLKRAGQLLGIAVPSDLLSNPTALKFAQTQLDADPRYQPWSVRAIIVADAETMVGHIRFHSRPDPDYLHPFARSAVEFGYRIFPEHRRRGYATEAINAAMDWARTAFGIGRFVVSVSPDNTPSLAVVARFGFVQVGQHVDEIDGIENVYLRDTTV